MTVGSPEGLGGSVSTGIISGFRRMGNSKVIQTTAPTSHGSSGGALLDMYGRLLGITSFTIVDGQNINFAYRSSYVYSLIPKKILTYIPWYDIEAYASTTKPLSYTYKPLVGLKGVAIYVADVSDDAKKDGLDTSKLKANIEALLRKDNITIYSSQTATENASQAVLGLYIELNKTSDGLAYAYSFQLSLIENMQVPRSIPVFTRAYTWYSFVQWSISIPEMPQRMYEKTNDAVEAFVKDYHDQNPI